MNRGNRGIGGGYKPVQWIDVGKNYGINWQSLLFKMVLGKSIQSILTTFW